MLNTSLSLTINDRGEQVAALHNNLVKLGYTIPKHELDEKLFGVGTRDALLRFQKKYKLRKSGKLDDRTDAALGRAVVVVESGEHRIEGRIYFDDSRVATRLKLAFYGRGFGGVETKIGEATTDDQGFYTFFIDPQANVHNVEVRCIDAQGTELALSKTKYELDRHEILYLVAPSDIRTLAPEYERLTAALTKQLGSLGKLGEAQENAERRDLTLLHKATGWDARLIALAAAAVKLSAESSIPTDFLYALFRVGMPTDKHLLCMVSEQALDKALAKAIEAGIVELDPRHLMSAKQSFKRFAETTRRETKAPGAQSSFGDMLAQSGLTPAEQRTFEALYFSHRGPAAELWKQAEAQGISRDSIQNLRLQGKLAVLTYNNLDLLKPLQAEIGSPDNLDRLVDLDLDKAETWKARITAITGEDEAALAQIIPPAYVGKSTEDRLKLYAADLARKVRLSFPTQVIRRLVERDELSLGGADAVTKRSIATFLKNATGLGFRLGSVSVGTFIARHGDLLFQDIDAENVESTTRHIRRLHRLYQITPSDESLKVLDELGFSSADEVVKLSVEEFCGHFGKQFPSPKEPELVWRKAQQVNTVTFNWVTTALHINSVPNIYGISGTKAERAEAQDHLRNQLKDHPTMESLFGSLDFCECEHCRSVISPAAYLVDLFQFLDPDEAQWAHKQEFWRERHDDLAYPHGRPFEVLTGRRPDLPQLPLTCENTHTALPYIDLVNEILEYSVVYGELPEASHDTGDATTDELLAEPHNILPAAYDKLKDPDRACYPLTLPFDLWLETVRGFLNHFNTSLWEILEAFRTNEELFSSDHRPYTDSRYFRAAVFLEYLGISPSEYDVFTRQRPGDWHRLYGDVDGDLRAALKCARTLARQLDVSYKQLVDIVQTGFVNPELEQLALLWKYGFGPSDALWYLDHRDDSEHEAETQAFVGRIRTRLAETLTDPDVVDAQVDDILGYIEERRSASSFERALVLRDQSGLCNFDETYLEYAEPAHSTPSGLDFVKINLFVRLWKKLGWSIEETDRALQVFLPFGSDDIAEANIDEAFRTALVYLAHLKALDDKVDAGRDGRLKLLTLWTDLPTTGHNPLYARLFLTPSVQKIDPVFDDPLGNYLRSGEDEPFTWDPDQPEDRANGNVALKNHLLGLQAALQLTADEVGQILADAGTDLETEALNLANCSLLYRYRFLANSLKLPIRDLITLKAMSGLDPFRALSPNALEAVEDDFPLTQTLRFVEIAQTIKDSRFQIEDLDYLLGHRFDPVGQYRDDPTALLALLKTLAGELHGILEKHAVPPDPAAFSDDQLRQKLALVLPAEVAERFFAMWTGTVEYEAVLTGVPTENQLDPESFADEAAIRVSYDAVREEQRLVYRGVLLHDERVLLEDRLSWIVADSFWASNFGRLLDSVQEDARRFFAEHLLKTALGDRHSFGFLEPDDFELLFSPSREQREKRARLAQTFLPYLQNQLARQMIVQTLAINLSADPALTEALLTDTRLLSDPSQAGDPQPLLNAFETAGERGVTATYRVTGDSREYTVWLPTADTQIYDPVSGALLELDSIRFEGHLEVPTTGAYRLYIACEERADVRAEIRFAHLPDPLLRAVTRGDEERPYELKSEVIELKAGIPYRFRCLVSNLNGSAMALLVQGEMLARGTLSRLTLYPQAAVERLARARTLLAKVCQIVQGFGLSERELRYLLTHPDDFDGLDLSGLPTHAFDALATELTALFGQFLRLANYTRLREELAAGEDLIDVFERARGTYDETIGSSDQLETMDEALCQFLADITRRELATVKQAAAHLGFGAVRSTANPALLVAADFTQERGIRRLWEILQIVQRLGVSVRDVARWGTPAHDADTARDLKHTVKARYEQQNWQRIVRPIHDALRRKQRDALVAFIMHHYKFESVERLYEYFLIDPGMEPVVQTSRIQLAISSVQTFVQRCLLNLEPKVAPSMINTKQWQWMKHYRVWEANRKIFLFPENWLEPEFRDDKTHLFQELESALLQGDVSRELVEDAFHTYLQGLETISRLDIVTMYREEDPNEREFYTLHVIGKTFDLSSKYFYRRYSNGMWTPWEPINANIEGDHVVAVVWRQRFHLFWVTFLPKPEASPLDPNQTYLERADDPVASTTPNTEVGVQLNWCEYFQGKWTTPTAGDLDAVVRAKVKATETFNKSNVFIHVTKEYDSDEEESAILIHLWSDDFLEIGYAWSEETNTEGWCETHQSTSFRVVSKNSQPEIEEITEPQGILYENSGVKVTRYGGRGPLQVKFETETATIDGQPVRVTLPTQEILDLSYSNRFLLLFSSNLSDVSFSAAERILSPFFYQDNLNTFFVDPVLTGSSLEESEDPEIRVGTPDFCMEADSFWQAVPVFGAQAHEPPRPPESVPPALIDPIARYAFVFRSDWATDPSTAVTFDGFLIGLSGGLGTKESMAGPPMTRESWDAMQPTLTGMGTRENVAAIHGLNVVGSHGVNTAVIANLRARHLGRDAR